MNEFTQTWFKCQQDLNNQKEWKKEQKYSKSFWTSLKTARPNYIFLLVAKQPWQFDQKYSY